MQNFTELYGRFLDTSGIENKRLDISYGKDEANKLDIYYPQQGNGPWPAIVFFHGGGFIKGNKGRYQLRPALRGLEKGYAVISVGYRLAPKHPASAAFDDAMAAMDYLLKHSAQLNLDVQRMAVWGESVGAMLACWAGFSLPVQAIISWYTPLDLRNINEAVFEGMFPAESLAAYIFDATGERLALLCEKYDPRYMEKKNLPAIMIQHGTADDLVPVQNAVEFHAHLSSVLPSNKNCLRLVEGAMHGIEDFDTPENLREVYEFLDKHIKPTKA